MSRNHKIIAILENLKDSEQNYPSELMETRREVFTKYVITLNKGKLNMTPKVLKDYRFDKFPRVKRTA